MSTLTHTLCRWRPARRAALLAPRRARCVAVRQRPKRRPARSGGEDLRRLAAPAEHGRPGSGGSYGCATQMRTQNGALVNGTKDYLRSSGGFILTHDHMGQHGRKRGWVILYASLPPCFLASFLACLRPCFLACLLACLLAPFLPRVRASLLACILTCLLACLLACPLTYIKTNLMYASALSHQAEVHLTRILSSLGSRPLGVSAEAIWRGPSWARRSPWRHAMGFGLWGVRGVRGVRGGFGYIWIKNRVTPKWGKPETISKTFGPSGG